MTYSGAGGGRPPGTARIGQVMKLNRSFFLFALLAAAAHWRVLNPESSGHIKRERDSNCESCCKPSLQGAAKGVQRERKDLLASWVHSALCVQIRALHSALCVRDAGPVALLD